MADEKLIVVECAGGCGRKLHLNNEHGTAMDLKRVGIANSAWCVVVGSGKMDLSSNFKDLCPDCFAKLKASNKQQK